jgi:hypothetical protein
MKERLPLLLVLGNIVAACTDSGSPSAADVMPRGDGLRHPANAGSVAGPDPGAAWARRACPPLCRVRLRPALNAQLRRETGRGRGLGASGLPPLCRVRLRKCEDRLHSHRASWVLTDRLVPARSGLRPARPAPP